MSVSNVVSALEALRAELREVERQLADYEALRRRRERLLNAIEATEAVEAMKDEVPTASAASRRDFQSEVQRLMLLQVKSDHPETPSEAALAILREVGSPIHIRELVRLIQAKAWFLDRTYEQLRATIAGTLDGRASRPDGGIAKTEKATYLWVPPTIEATPAVEQQPALGEFGDQWRSELGIRRTH